MRNTLLLILIMMLAVILRFWGLGYDLPNVYNLDEPIIMNKAVPAADGIYRHGAILRGSLPVYAVGSTIRFLSLIVPQLKMGFPTFTESYQHDKTAFYLIGRSVNALYGTIEILLLYWLSWILFDKRSALLSAFFLSISPLAIQFAHVVSPDTPVSATMLLTIIVAVIANRKYNMPLFLVAGSLAGFSVGQKFPGIFTLIFVLSLFSIEARTKTRSSLRMLTYAFLIVSFSTVTYILSYPYIFKDIQILVAEWYFETSRIRYWDRPPYVDFGVYSRILDSALWVRRGIGTFLYYLGIMGFLLTVRRKHTISIVVGIYAFLYFFANTIPVKINESRVVPVLSFVSLFATPALIRVWQHLFAGTTIRKSVRTFTLVLLVLSVCIASLIKSIFLIRAYASSDTRNQEEDWVKTHQLNELSTLRDPFTTDESNFTFDPAHHRYSPQRDRMIHKQTIASLQNYRHAIVNFDEFAQWYYSWERYQPELHKIADVYRYLDNHTNKVAEFVPRITNINEEDLDFLLHANQWVFNQVRGPKITIYKLQ